MGSICRQDREGFFSALDDAIHQPFRGQKIPGFFEVRDYLHPVSYTHLDVYKRQSESSRHNR